MLSSRLIFGLKPVKQTAAKDTRTPDQLDADVDVDVDSHPDWLPPYINPISICFLICLRGTLTLSNKSLCNPKGCVVCVCVSLFGGV